MATVEPLRALNLEPADQESFIRFYRTLPEKPATTIRIFSRDNFYSLHGEDALFGSKHVFNSTATIKRMGELHTLDYLVLSRGNFENFIRDLLLVKQYRVEVFTKATNRGNEWEIEFKGSPGNLTQFENILFTGGEACVTSCVIALKIATNEGVRNLGISCIDLEASQISVCEFTDNELLSELEAIVVQLGPKECLLPTGDSADIDRIQLIMERNNILVTRVPKVDFTATNLEQDLNRLLYFKPSQQRSCTSLPEYSFKLAMLGVNALLKYFDLMSTTNYFNHIKLVLFDVKRFVHLDAGAIASLNILPKPGVPLKRESTILGLLDTCRLASGRRLIRQWLKQPLRDINVINERQDVVEAFVKDAEIRDALHDDYLRGFPDMSVLNKRLLHKKASLQDCYSLYKCVERCPLVLRELRKANNKSVQSALADPLLEYLQDMDRFQQMIEQTIDFDGVSRGEFLVKADFDEDLVELHKQKKVLQEKINKEFSSVSKDLEKVKLEQTAQHGHVFRVTLREEQDLRDRGKYKIIDAVKGGVRFTTNILSDLNVDYEDINKQYGDQQQNVVQEIISIAASYAETIMNLDGVLAKIDVLIAFAVAASAASVPYVRPKMLAEGSGVLKIKQARHPCVEYQANISYIANDISLNKDEHTFEIITGPNMGGKSTYIRSIGVIVLMAHIGSFVSCDEATISMVDSILARIGADDCELKGLSTFMVEMVESAAALRVVTDKSLVIIDELGRGTSTFDGCGIAWAIAEVLAKIKAFSLFATHFYEITTMVKEFSNIQNRHVTALIEGKKITHLYQLRAGACDKSFGIPIARVLKLQQGVIDFAEELHAELDPKIHMDQEMSADKKMEEVMSGLKFIEDLFESHEKIDLDTATDEEVLKNVLALKAKALNHNNSYLKSLELSKSFLDKVKKKGPLTVNGRTNGIAHQHGNAVLTNDELSKEFDEEF